ncbi:MAG: sigma factor-like helix-turn-helix DNA-binding protein [Myxococcota bacterium]|nr:sigma factor-like helix-turn-helix DNA-binding protein [Myxococcota bacterium]
MNGIALETGSNPALPALDPHGCGSCGLTPDVTLADLQTACVSCVSALCARMLCRFLPLSRLLFGADSVARAELEAHLVEAASAESPDRERSLPAWLEARLVTRALGRSLLPAPRSRRGRELSSASASPEARYERALADLPPSQRAVVVACDGLGNDRTRVAREIGVSEEAVRRLLDQGRRFIAARLREPALHRVSGGSREGAARSQKSQPSNAPASAQRIPA